MHHEKNDAAIGSRICSANPMLRGCRLFLLVAIVLGTLTACAQQPKHFPMPPEEELPSPAPEEPAEVPEPETALPPRTAEEASGPAVLALLSHAETQREAGELDRAAATVERALDVEPRNPFVYSRLAALRLIQGQPGQTEALASKSNSLGGDNPYLQARNWTLIARARRMRGDSLGADTAAARADYYRSRLPDERP